MNKERFFLGYCSQFKKGLSIFPPLVKDVIGNSSYSIYYKLLTASQEEIEDSFIENGQILEKYPTPLEFLLNNCYHNKDYEKATKEALFFFTHQQPTLLYKEKMIVFGDISKLLLEGKGLADFIYITEEDFFQFQNVIRESVSDDLKKEPDPNEHPKIKAMKRKARQRDKIKAKNNGLDLFSILASICCMGLGITPLNIGEMSYASIKAIMEKYQQKEKYDIDIQSLLAGADSKKIKPEYWIKNSEN